MRVSSDSFDISSEKTATVCLSFSATCCAMLRASAVFAHGRARGEDEEVAAVHAAGHLVELGEAGADALDALAGVEEGVDAAFVAF